MPIQYPRKCNNCDYISNNPSMYHYHKQTHTPIPDGQLCNHGCNTPALFRGTGGKYTCLKNAHQCPEYIKQHSARIAKQWEGNTLRKEQTKERFLKTCAGIPAVIDKMKETRRKKSGILTPDQARDYRHYARLIRQNAQSWAKEQGYLLGPQTFHVDHKLSILDAWNSGLSVEIVNHPANLQILEAKQNSSKGSNSSITVEELLKLIE